MHFGRVIGTACSSFAITNIDDIFVLVTFFAEASTKKATTPAKIALGQYLGFTVIVIISMIGFGASLVLPSEPIGFLGLLPILLGVWNLIKLLLPCDDEETAEDDIEAVSKLAGMRSIVKVAAITLMNGGDNIGTYIPLFSQANGAEIAVYVIVFYIMLGIWCLAAFAVMRQKHILLVAEKYARIFIPFLYIGLGIFIVVKSSCYPWSVERINKSTSAHSGRTILAVVTTSVLLLCIGAMLWLRQRRYRSDDGQNGGRVSPTLPHPVQSHQSDNSAPHDQT